MLEGEVPEQVQISIVDDDESVREAMVALMQSCGYAAEAFGSAAAFLASDRRRHTACLIADFHMPGMTGLQLGAALAAAGDPIPTILITARHQPALRERALAAGCVCYLAQPIE